MRNSEDFKLSNGGKRFLTILALVVLFFILAGLNDVIEYLHFK